MNLDIDAKIKNMIREVLAEPRPMFDGLIRVVTVDEVQTQSECGYNLIRIIEPTETRATLFVMGQARAEGGNNGE